MQTNNSIKSELTKEDVISELKLQLSADYERKSRWVIVEGWDDVRFFRGRLQSYVTSKESYSGKQGVYEIVEYFSDDRLVGICDRDYDEIVANPRIFYYDYSCMEMMVLSDFSMFGRLFAEYYNGKKTACELYEHILKSLQWLSSLRSYNQKEKLKIRFNGLSIQKCIVGESFKSNNASQHLLQINPNCQNLNKVLENECIWCESGESIEKLLYLTRGHDFLEFFQTVCNESRTKIPKRTKNVSVDDISASLRCAYSNSDLRKTRLYSRLKEYFQQDIFCV